MESRTLNESVRELESDGGAVPVDLRVAGEEKRDVSVLVCVPLVHTAPGFFSGESS